MANGVTVRPDCSGEPEAVLEVERQDQPEPAEPAEVRRPEDDPRGVAGRLREQPYVEHGAPPRLTTRRSQCTKAHAATGRQEHQEPQRGRGVGHRLDDRQQHGQHRERRAARRRGRRSGSGPCPSRGSACGSQRAASTMPTSPIGTLTKNTHRQPSSAPKAAMISPPRTGPTADETPTVVPKRPKARPRSSPRNSCWISPLFCGVEQAGGGALEQPARSPAGARSGASPAAALVSVKPTRPSRNMRRRPTTSPSRPPATSVSPKVSA